MPIRISKLLYNLSVYLTYNSLCITMDLDITFFVLYNINNNYFFLGER